MTEACYVDAFLTKQPKEGISIVQARLKDAIALDHEFAEYIKERALVEENYAKSLSKVSKKLYTTDPVVLGHFGPIWELLINELSQAANYHSEFAQQMTQEIEKPMRTACSEDIHRIQQMDAIVQKKKSVRGSIFKKKPIEMTGEWQTDGVEYLNLHQKVDQARLARLKFMVEKFETLQSDHLEKQVQMTHIALSSVKEFDVEHDIRDFCKERGKGLQTLTPKSMPMRPRSSTTNSHDSTRSTNKFKSVFGRRKKSQDQLSQFDYPNHPITTPVDTNHALTAVTPNTIVPNPLIDIVPSRAQPNPASLVDSEGYSIPPKTTSTYTHAFGSDVSSKESPSDIESDMQSLSWSQRYQVSIKDSIVQEETNQANESFNKMASILRERTPTVTRRARGRRENAPRSQTYSTLFTTGPATNASQTRSNSMIFLSSSETNPFLATSSFIPPHMPSSPSLHSLKARTSEASLQLQSIPEAQQTQQEQLIPPLSASVRESVMIVDPDTIHVTGQVLLHCQDTSLGSIPLRLQYNSHLSGLTACSPRITANPDGDYLFDTDGLTQGQSVACFTYKTTASVSALPFQLSASWKCVQDVSYLIVKHGKNLDISSTDIKGNIYVVMDDTVTNVQSTPQGVWDTSSKRLTWHIRDLLQQYQGPEGPQQRLLAKFYVNQAGTPQPLCFSYLLKNYSISGLSVQSSAIEIKQTGCVIQSESL
ncbi:hypothetical protein BD560DRAFT_492133 [Blakeslea trispora]|nr:hypothetical protein BD560DRAFT_492133 [Blakeslea trispora]